MELPTAVAAALDVLTTEVEVLPCDPRYADTADFCAHYGVPPSHSANTILVASRKPEGHVAACVVAADRRLDVNGRVRRLMGVRKLSFADAAQTRETTGMELGGVTVVGLPVGMPIYVDAGLMDLEWVILGAGSRHAKLKASPHLFTELDGARLIDDLSFPAEG